MSRAPFDFSAACSRLCDHDQVKQVQLALAAKVSPSTVSRWINGIGKPPEVDDLRNMEACDFLPEWFHQACRDVVPPSLRRVDLASLDADGDKAVTARDAEIWAARKQAVAAERQTHLVEDLGGGPISEAELVEQKRLEVEERELSRNETLALEVAAGRGGVSWR